MAKAIDLPITGLESDKSWERYKGNRVREYLQKKVGAFYRPDRRQDDNAYHLLGFETEETKANWLKRWQAAVKANDDEAISALWTDKLIIQDTSIGGNTEKQNSVELIAGNSQSSLVSIDGSLKLKLRFTSIEYNPVTEETNDTGESATLKIERRANSNDNWVEVTTTTIPSVGINDTDKFIDVDISRLLPNGTWQLRCTATGQVTEITTPAVQFGNVIKTKLGLTLATSWWVPNTTDNVTLSYYINGSIAKTLNYEISDKNGTIENRGNIPIGTSVYIESARDITVSGLTHGVHNVKAWLTVDGTTTKSDAVNSQIMVVTDSTKKDILVAVSDVAASVTNYVQSSIFKFAVYNPNAETTKIKFDITNQAKTVTYASSTGNYKNSTKVEYQNTFEIESQDKSLDAYIHIYDDNNNELIDAIGFSIDNTKNFAPTENADFILNPKSRNNNEDNPNTIINAADGSLVKSTFSNFGFASDGWTSDSNGVKCLRVPSGTEVDIDYEPFSAFTYSGNNMASMTMEFDIATRNIVNEDVAILKVCSYNTNKNPIGFELKPLEACFMTTNLQNRRDQDIMFQDNTSTHIAVNIIYNLASSGMNYIRIFINGVINREIEYSSSDSFLQYIDGKLTSQGIRIGAEGADIDIYSIRVYKRALSASQIRQDYISSLNTTEEKIAFRNANDILGDSNLIDYSKTYDKYNTILWTGSLPSYANKTNTRGDVKIHIIGDPAHSGEMKNVESKGQGTSSKGYWKWNQQFKTSYKDENGNEVKTDWIDENGVSHGAVYQLADGLPLATKLVWKLNWASSQQSHKIGSVNLFTDLWRLVIGGNGITNYTDADGNKPYANCRVSTVQKPFMLFTRATEDSDPVFYGLVTFGPGKADKPTFGYYKNVLSDMCMLEGSDNGVPLAEHRVPWMLDEVTYNEDEEAYQYNGENQFDFDMGNKDLVEQYFVPAFNFVFLHNLNITYFSGTYEQLIASKDTNKVKQYWVTADSTDGSHHKFDLFRWDYVTNTWVNASTTKTSGVYDALNLNTQTGTGTGDNFDNINNLFISWRKNDFKAHAGDYFNVNDLMYCMQFLKLVGASDNRCKNTYLYIDPVTHKICFMQDDMDTILATDNVGRKNKPYYVEEHDLDTNGNHYWNGSDNVLYNTIEAVFSDELRATMNSILTGMATLGGGNVTACMEKYYFSVQKYFPAVAYNETARLLYEEAAIHYNDGSYTPSTAPLSQSLGDQLQAELEWWKRREIYISSYAKYGAFSVKDGTVGDTSGSGALVFRSITDTDGNTPNYKFTVVPSMWLYPSFAKGTTEYDGNTRVKAGESFTSSTISADGNTNIYIRGINYFKSIGKFGDKPVAEQFNLAADKLVEFDASAITGKAQQFRPSQMSITTPLLSNLNLEGVSTIVGSIDLSSLTRLKTANLKGTGATSVKIPQTKTIETINLPAITDIELAEVPNLSTFTIESVNNLKNITIGNNVGSGFNIVALLSKCKSSNIKLNKITIDNVNITNLDHTILEYIADIPEVSITGIIRVNGTLTLDTISKLKGKFGDIDNKNNPLYIYYTKYAITSVSLDNNEDYFNEIGTYKLNYSINPTNGNNITSIVWSINTNDYATIDADTGEVTVNSIGNEEDKTKITVTLTLNLMDGSTVTDSTDIYLYKPSAKLGDIVYADGTYSSKLKSNKTPIGVCFYVSDNLRLMCSLDFAKNGKRMAWGLYSGTIANVTLADSTEDVYDTPLTNFNSFKSIGSRNLNYIKSGDLLDSNGEFKKFDSTTAMGQLGLMVVTEDTYNKYISYLNELGYLSGDSIPYGLYNTIVIIAHRDTVLKDSNVNLTIPTATNGKSEAIVLEELLTKISTDRGGDYKEYYYPAASECYAYQPSVKDGEILLDKFKTHHWWLPSLGEQLRMMYYEDRGYDITKHDDAIFSNAYKLGIFKPIYSSIYNIYTSNENSASSAIVIDNGITINFNGTTKDREFFVRPICAF